MKNKLSHLLISFLLLFPFRLPISVLLIKLFNWIASLGSTDAIPSHVLMGNVVVTKIIYNLALSVWFVIALELGSRKWMGRKSFLKGDRISYTPTEWTKEEQLCYWWVIPCGVLLLAFMGYDIYSTIQLFPMVK